MYEIRFLPAAERYFKKIKEKGLKSAFREALAVIAQNPYYCIRLVTTVYI